MHRIAKANVVEEGSRARAQALATCENETAHAMRLFFALIALGVGIASVSSLALAWDGSYTLFDLLETQLPVASYGRLTDLVLRAPVVAASGLTSDPLILQTVFTLPYALLPLVALAAAWWVVRDDAQPLFVWAALGIGLATLPGQACFVCQGVSSVQLFWPILLAVLVGMPHEQVPLVAALGLAILFLHPSAIPLFAFAAGSATLMGIRYHERRRASWIAAIGFGLASAAAEVKLVSENSSYELGKLSFAMIQSNFQTALAGLPFAALLIAGAAALLIFFQPFTSNPTRIVAVARISISIPYALALITGVWQLVRIKPTFVGYYPLGAVCKRELAKLQLISLALAGALLFLWASSARLWAQAINFRGLVLFTSFPFMLLALFEALAHNPSRWLEASIIWKQRFRIAQIAAAIFLSTIATQGIVWQNLTQRLRAAMDSTAAACVSATSLEWLGMTPLNHWAVTSYSLVMQGRTPQQVVMFGNGCTTSSFREGLPVAIFSAGSVDVRGWQGGWFDLSALGAKLIAQYDAPPKCDYPLTDGWYVIEENGEDWWRWASGDARVRVIVAQDTAATMNGEVASFRQPNQIEVWLNGQMQTTIEVTQAGAHSMPPLSVNLTRGEDTIEFKSHNPAILNPSDDRPLAMAVKNLTLTSSDGVVLCR